jgi:hypothetical protein
MEQFIFATVLVMGFAASAAAQYPLLPHSGI